MLPGLDGIPAAAVLDRLALLKYRNARGSHIYIRPSGEHRFTVLDDLNETSLARLSADGFNPCAVVETSVGNFQAWLKHPAVFPKLIGTSPHRRLPVATMPIRARRTGGDSGGSRLHKLQTQVPQARRSLPFRSAQKSQRRAVSNGRSLRPGNHETLRRAGTGARGTASAGFSFSPTGTEVIELCLWNASAPRPSTRTDPPPQTSPSVSPLMPMA